jgi:hypothetical protein
LVTGNRQIKLDPEKREKLLNVLSIREYITRNSRAAII